MPVYYWQEDGGNSLPYLVGCVFTYSAYKWIKSTRNDSNQNGIRQLNSQSPKDNAIGASDSDRKQNDYDTSIENCLAHATEDFHAVDAKNEVITRSEVDKNLVCSTTESDEDTDEARKRAESKVESKVRLRAKFSTLFSAEAPKYLENQGEHHNEAFESDCEDIL